MRRIDADAYCKEMQEYVFPITENNLMGAADAYYRCVHLLENAPTIDPDTLRPKGRWLHREDTGIAYCSECDMDAVEDGTNYCPECGADMREV